LEELQEQRAVRKTRQRIVLRLVREPSLVPLALDGDGGEVREQVDDLLVLGVGLARVVVGERERAERSSVDRRRDPLGPDYGYRSACVCLRDT